MKKNITREFVGTNPYRTDKGLQALMRSVRWVAMVLLSIPVALLFPILAMVSVTFIIGLSFRSKSVAAGSAILVVLGVFGWMNSTKGISGDWAWYTQHFLWLQRMPFSQYWGQQIGAFTIKSSEPVYYFVAATVAKLTGGSIPVLAWVISSLIYVPLGISAGVISARLTKLPIHTATATLVALMVGVTFTLTTQLVRQEIAGAFLVAGFVLFYFGRRFNGVLLATLAIFTHNSVVAPFVVVISVTVLAVGQKPMAWRKLVLLWVVFLAIGSAYVLVGPGADYNESAKSDGVISPQVILMDVSILMAFLFVRSRLGEPRRFLDILAAAAIVYSGFLIGVSPAPIPLLRMYFFVELFRALMVCTIICTLPISRFGPILALPILLTAIAYVEMRIVSSPFWYGGGVVAHLLRPFALFN